MHPMFWRNLVVVLLLSPITMSAQVNLKVGYSAGFSDQEMFHSILERNNSLYSYTSPYDQTKYLHGIEAGLRCRLGFTAMELGWKRSMNFLKANGRNAQNQQFDNRLKVNLDAVMLGIESFVGKFSFGGSVDYNFMNIKTILDQPAISTRIKDQAWGNHFFVSYDFGGQSYMRLVLRPYVQLYWTDMDLTDLDIVMNNTEPPVRYKQDFLTYGISFLFYNGASGY